MRFRNVVAMLLALFALGACTREPSPETPKEQASAPVIADPTPPDPPNSVEVPADIKHLPSFMLLTVGATASEAEKDGIEVQENMRLFRTDSAVSEILSFYSQQMKDRGWTTDNQVAKSSKVGVSIQQYRHGSEALFLVISEPEEPQSSDDTKRKRHVALLPAILKKPKT